MNLRNWSHSIITKLLVLGLSLVMFSVVVRYFTLSGFLREDLSTVVAEQQLSLANYAAADIDQKILQRQTLLENLAKALPGQLLSQPTALQTWLATRESYAPLLSAGLMVTDLQGRVLAAHSPDTSLAATPISPADILHAIADGKTYVGKPFKAGPQGDPVLPISVPLTNLAGDPVGVLTGITHLYAPGFLDVLMSSHIGNSSGGFLLVSPRDRVFVASSRPEMVLQPTPPEGVNPLHDRAMNGYRGSGLTTNAQGVEEISAMVTVPSTGWFVVARIPTSDALATVTRLKSFLIRNGVLAVAVFETLFFFALFFLLRPLFHAAAQADRMTLGDAPLEPLPVTRNDEVGHLITAFNRLLNNLNTQQAELARLAHHDSLTGLPNRVLLADRLERALEQAKHEHTAVALLFLDLDGFKPINDTLGHACGDQVLHLASERFTQVVRKADTVARVGGDEFVILLPSLEEPSHEAATTVARKLIEALQKPFDVGQTPCLLGVSIGIAIGHGNTSPEALFRAADQAMYQAKDAGRGRYVFANSV